jgi:hypothetical protein
VRTREAKLARVCAEASGAEALITHLRLTIAKMRRNLFGQRSERKARVLDQMELQLEELEQPRRKTNLRPSKQPPLWTSRPPFIAAQPAAFGLHRMPRVQQAQF